MVLTAALGASVLFTAHASAQEPSVPGPMRAPWTDVAPAREGDAVRAAAVGIPDERIGRFAPRRDSARTRGRARALAAIHRWVDDALARVHAHPREATAAHAAIERTARVTRVRPLVDAGAVVVVEVPVGALRDACSRGGLPWS